MSVRADQNCRHPRDEKFSRMHLHYKNGQCVNQPRSIRIFGRKRCLPCDAVSASRRLSARFVSTFVSRHRLLPELRGGRARHLDSRAAAVAVFVLHARRVGRSNQPSGRTSSPRHVPGDGGLGWSDARRCCRPAPLASLATARRLVRHPMATRFRPACFAAYNALSARWRSAS